MLDRLKQILENRKELYRSLHNTKDYTLNFGSNNYLNFSDSTKSKNISTGAGGSRLLSGNHSIFHEFEKKIASDTNQEDSLIYSSGYLANLSTLSTLIDLLKPTIFFDRLNHASLYDALKLNSCSYFRYKNIDELSLLLSKNSSKYNIIVSETLFSMDGHFCNIQNLISLAQKFNCLLYLDESHALGLFGKKGYGLSTSYDLTHINCIIMNSFGKALGGSGASISTNKTIKNILINFSRGFIYSTAPSPGLMNELFNRWKMIKKLDQKRKHLYKLSIYTTDLMIKKGFKQTHDQGSVIIPILLNSTHTSQNIQKRLINNKIYLPIIRPPTVPSTRFRLSLNTSHTTNNIDKLFECLSN